MSEARRMDARPDETSVGDVGLVMRSSFARRIACDPEVHESLVDALWSDPDGLVEDGSPLKEGDRTTVVLVEGAPSDGSNGEACVLKRYNLRHALHTAGHGVIRSRARWCWVNACRLRSAGIRSPRPLGYLELRVGPFRGRSFLLTEYVEAPTLLDVLQHGDRERAAALAVEFGRIWRELGRLRVGYGDMKATNFLVDDRDRIWLVDLDGMRVHRNPAMFRHKRARDYERFMRNWQGQEEVAAMFRARLDTDGVPVAR